MVTRALEAEAEAEAAGGGVISSLQRTATTSSSTPVGRWSLLILSSRMQGTASQVRALKCTPTCMLPTISCDSASNVFYWRAQSCFLFIPSHSSEKKHHKSYIGEDKNVVIY